jgi:hypothetical protein
MPIWSNGKNGKEYRATMGGKAIGGIFSVGIEDRYRWKDSVQNDDELRLWVVDGIAHGLRPWFTKFDCKVIDSRWMPVVEQLYQWHYTNERYLRNTRPLARVAIVYSQQTAMFYGGEDARSKVEDPALGFYQALVEARIPFEMVHDRLLDAEHISQFRTLILPNIAALSTAQCAQLTQFVQNGGSLIATYETSLYNEWGVRQPNFGLASLFGANFAGQVEGPMLNSYLALDRSASNAFHELLKDLDGTPRIINAANQVSVTPTDTTPQPLQVIPTYPDLPMEEVFPRANAPKGQPAVILRSAGKGRVAYLPGDIDRTFWETLNNDLARLLRNTVLWATNEPAPLTVTGKGVLDISLWEQKDSITAHLVNLTNPMLMKGPVREILPISAQQVAIKIPDGRTAKQARLLVSKARPAFTYHQNIVYLDIPSIALHEVVAIDLV